MKSRVAMAALALLALAAGASSAQQAKTDPQSNFEPRSAPGAGQKLLETFAGDWDVVKTFHPRTGAPVRTEGRCRQTMIHDGRFLQADFVFGEGNRRSTGLGIIGFEPETGTFTSFWTDSRQTRMSVRQSQEPFDGVRIVLFSRSLEGTGKESRRSKTISELQDGGRKLVHRQYALGANGEERLMMELVMTRRSAQP